MKPLLTILLLLIIVGCGNQRHLRTVCNCEQKKELKEFVQKSIGSANNMSDEEMEDVIIQLEASGSNIICEQKIIIFSPSGLLLKNESKLDSCDTVF